MRRRLHRRGGGASLVAGTRAGPVPRSRDHDGRGQGQQGEAAGDPATPACAHGDKYTPIRTATATATINIGAITMPRLTGRVGAATLGLLLAFGALSAHDFWIVPLAFELEPGAVLEAHAQTSSRFPTSVAAIVPERIADARLIGAASEERLTDLTVRGTSLVLRHRPADGQRVVAVTLVARSTRTTPERLERYIALEGAPELAARYRREGAYPTTDSVTQVVTKFAKTTVAVGRGGRTAFDRAAGHVLELMPLSDPLRLRPGDTLAVRLFYRGRPVVGAHLHAGAAPAGLTTASDTAAARAATWSDVTMITGPDGTARLAVPTAGLWNVRTLYGAPLPDTPGTWEVLFASLVFAVP